MDVVWIMDYGYLEEKKGEYYFKTRGNKKYSSKEYGKTMLIPTIFIPPIIGSQ
jgi:hypothetical protein